MAEDKEVDQSQKTEQPTAHRLEKARKKGQVAISKEINHWFMILAVTLLIAMVFPGTLKKISFVLSRFLENANGIPTDGLGLLKVIKQACKEIAVSLGIPALFLTIAALFSGFVQTRFNISAENMKPKLEKLSPLKGIKRMFGVKSLVEFLKNVLKLAIVAFISFLVILPETSQFHVLPHFTVFEFLGELQETFLRLLIAIFGIMTAVAGLDYAFQKMQMTKSLKMSRQEVKEEHKELEGDPQIKQQLRKLRQERSRRRAVGEVENATVLLTNPTHYSIALKYDRETMGAPVVLAKGVDYLALKMREAADKHDVPRYEDAPLARSIYADVKEGQEIPVEYYEAVAAIIRYVMELDSSRTL